jgi:hypothetical protein
MRAKLHSVLYTKFLTEHPMVGNLEPNAIDLSLEEFRGC